MGTEHYKLPLEDSKPGHVPISPYTAHSEIEVYALCVTHSQLESHIHVHTLLRMLNSLQNCHTKSCLHAANDPDPQPT